jgi:hypothetical protein
MCDHDSQQITETREMVQVDQRPAKRASNGPTQNGDSSTHQRGRQARNPYRAADFLSNVSNFKIIESTLRGTPISPRPALRQLSLNPHSTKQRASSLPMPSSTPQPKSQLPRHSTPLVSSISNSHHLRPLNNPGSTARPFASSASRPRSSHTSAAIWTMHGLPSRPVSSTAHSGLSSHLS